MITDWIGNAAQEQYHDRAIVQQFQNLFAGTEPNHHHKDDTDSDSEMDETTTVNEENDECDVVLVVKSQQSQHETNGIELHETVNTHQIVTPMSTTTTIQPPPQESSSNSNLLLRGPARNSDDIDMTAIPFVPNDVISSFSTTTFCYTCRRPATTLCSQCHGVYFCHDTCQTNGYGTKKSDIYIYIVTLTIDNDSTQRFLLFSFLCWIFFFASLFFVDGHMIVCARFGKCIRIGEIPNSPISFHPLSMTIPITTTGTRKIRMTYGMKRLLYHANVNYHQHHTYCF